MPRVVKGPDGISRIFPDDATDAEISSALNESAPKPPETSAGARFAEGAWKNLNPLNAVKALVHPLDAVGGIIDSHIEQLQKAKTAYDEGRYSEMVGHLGGAALPILGPAAANAGERIGEGDIAGGLGEAVGLIGAMQEPKLIKPALRGARALGEGASTAAQKAAPIATRVAAATVKPGGAAIGALGGSAVGGPVGGTIGAVIGATIGDEIAARIKGKVKPAPATPLEKPAGPPAETPLEMTRRLRAEHRAGQSAPTETPAPSTGPKNAPVRNPDTGQWTKPAAFDPRTALQSAKEAFEAAGETPRPGEASNAMELIRAGKSPTDAVALILSRSRPAELSPAAELARRLGTPTEAERIAAQDARWQRGEVKTPSAETARANRKK